MKSYYITVVLAAAAMNINAQLVVDSLGRVGVGTETPKSLLSVGGGRNDASFAFYGNDKKYGCYCVNQTQDLNFIYGCNIYAINSIGGSVGVKSIVTGTDSVSSSPTIGIQGLAGKAKKTVGVFGGKFSSPTSNYSSFAGIFGSESTSSPYFESNIGTYAGYFRGKVHVTNGIYATVLSPTTSPSPSGQNGTTILSDRGESVTDKLSQVQAVQFLRYDPTQETNTSRASLEDIDTDNMSPEELDSLAEAMGDIEPERYLSPVQYGLDADQLKEVYPELVYEDANGNVSINYVEMVPLLVQCINELSAKVAELEGTSPRKAKAQPTAIEETVSDVDMVRMDQNNPNPFSESTVIALNIPSNAQVSTIFIYDMSGKQVQSLPVSERGETNITVYATDLSAGMYIYTLVIDGKVAVTRRMILTK